MPHPHTSLTSPSAFLQVNVSPNMFASLGPEGYQAVSDLHLRALSREAPNITTHLFTSFIVLQMYFPDSQLSLPNTPHLFIPILSHRIIFQKAVKFVHSLCSFLLSCSLLHKSKYYFTFIWLAHTYTHTHISYTTNVVH